ncbi:MAG: choice-of-anchor J domain-containing protein [Candidatus Cloacimonetes bacterium]|nr:choice-of-anchor J domain-containing protein [Candidatus Cloacimonadota bacterium]
MRRITVIVILMLWTLLLIAQNPPTNLIATPGYELVTLNWQPPIIEGEMELVNHTTSFGGVMYQQFGYGYGVVFNTSDLTGALLEAIDFKHSSFGQMGPHSYKIHIMDAEYMTTLAVIENIFTIAEDDWELDIQLGSLAAPDWTGIFIEPLSGVQDNAYPLLNYDLNQDFYSMVIDLSDNSIVQLVNPIGDFFIDLWVSIPDTQSRIKLSLEERDRYFIGYNIYRLGSMINTTPLIEREYVDTGLENGSPYGYFVTAVFTEGESSPSNLVTVTPVVVPGMYWYHGFEDTSKPVGWDSWDIDGDGYDWQFEMFTDLDAYAGYGSVASYSYINGEGAVHPENWVISDSIYVETGSYLYYWVRATEEAFPLEHYQVKIALWADSLTTTNFIDTIHEETLSDNFWKQIEIPLDAYEGQLIHLAWVHLNSTNQFCIQIDEMYIADQQVVGDSPPPSVTMMELKIAPNPFNPETTISFNLKIPQNVVLEIFNIRGQKVSRIINERLSPGAHKVVWNGTDTTGHNVASGIYFCRLATETSEVFRKLLLLK